MAATYQYERLPIVIAADPGTHISLQSVFDQAFGPGWSFDPGGSIYSKSTASQTYIEANSGELIYFGHWNSNIEADGYFIVDGKQVPFGESMFLKDFSNIEIVAGNALTPLLNVAVHNSYGAGKDSVFTWYTLTIVPTATFSNSGSPVTGADVAAKALQFAQVYNVALPYDCGWIAEVIAASVGAPMPVRCYSLNPAENEEGGLWRIIHRGNENPISDWQKLLQPGDIVRLDWKNSTFHTTTVVQAEGPDGRIKVVDNSGPNGEITLRSVNFEPNAEPASITIYRIGSDQLYLLEGSESGEKLHGTTQADDLRGAGGNDILAAGAGDDKIVAGTGNDTVDGGPGIDSVWINALRSGVKVGMSSDGKTIITSADGRDVLTNVEMVHFSDGQLVALSALGPPAPAVSTLPAIATSQFVTGANPTTGELDIRAAAAAAAHDYYANVLKVANPALGPYESLGVSFSALSAFQAKYGASSSASFVADIYDDVFHRAPTSGQQKAFEDQYAYFTSLYQKAGISAGTADLQARGAVLGQMVGYVMIDPAEAGRAGQTIDDQAQNFLASLPRVDLVGSSADPAML
jgi:Ca2+-binding RTX toxin-like protein